MALYESLTEAERTQVPQVLRVWLRYRSEKYFGEVRTPPGGEEKPKPIDTFVIIKLDKENPKVVAHVPGKDGNEKAEQVADKLCQP